MRVLLAIGGIVGVLGALLPGQAMAYVRTTTESGKPFVWPNPNITVILYSKGSRPTSRTTSC
jgi:hypothetical protein